MSVGEYFNIGDPALQIRADEDGMKDPLNLLREAFDIEELEAYKVPLGRNGVLLLLD